MKKVLPVFLAACAVFFGCAAKTHYTEPVDNGVRLYLKMPEARSVSIASSFGGFAPVPAVRDEDGVWSATVPSSEPFDYFYIVDGEAFTPPCLLSRPDGFGGKTCIFDSRP